MSQENQNIKYSSKALLNSAVVIPALNPMTNLVAFVQELIDSGISQVIVVNDGSSPSFNDIFQQINNMKRCILLVHEVNRGKGRALKTGFAYFLEHFPNLNGVVTADADGQHAVEDICRVCEKLAIKNESLILGMRDFKNNNVPKRSYMGNRLTSSIFRILYGSYLEDTQTGLRGVPRSELLWMINLQGERYEFEINMLIQCKWRNIVFTSLPIQTLYFNNNSGTHFNTFIDAGRIFLCLISGFIKYSLSSLISGILDVLTFFILNSLVLSFLPTPNRLFTSTVIARVLSSCCNFSINRKLFSADVDRLPKLVARYYSLWLIQLITSYGLVYATSIHFNIHDSIIKICIDVFLGIFSYQIQLRWVFKDKDLGIEIC